MIFWTICQAKADRLDEVDPSFFLSSQEMTRYHSMRFPKRRREWLLGRWTAKTLLRTCLKETADKPFKTFSVLNMPEGAPYFTMQEVNPFPVGLSISHREELAFCALSTATGQRLGVDIERVEPRAEVFLEDYFTASEQAYARSLDEASRVVWVTAAWSLKEAVLKALGKGLRVDTRQVELDFNRNSSEFEHDSQDWVPVNVTTHRLGDEKIYGFTRCFEQNVLTMAFSEPQHAVPAAKDMAKELDPFGGQPLLGVEFCQIDTL